MKNNEINNIVSNIINEYNQREAAIAKATAEIKKAREALHQAYLKRKEAKGGSVINWKQYAENMAALLNQLPEHTKFTPTQLAHIYSLAYPQDKNVGVLHINYIAQKCRPLDGIGVMVKGLDYTDGHKSYYYRRGEAKVVCS